MFILTAAAAHWRDVGVSAQRLNNEKQLSVKGLAEDEQKLVQRNLVVMPELFEKPHHEPTLPLAMSDNLTTAPGDVPLKELRARVEAQKSQFRHDNTIIPSTPQPGQPVEIWATTGVDLPLERAVL